MEDLIWTQCSSKSINQVIQNEIVPAPPLLVVEVAPREHKGEFELCAKDAPKLCQILHRSREVLGILLKYFVPAGNDAASPPYARSLVSRPSLYMCVSVAKVCRGTE